LDLSAHEPTHVVCTTHLFAHQIFQLWQINEQLFSRAWPDVIASANYVRQIAHTSVIEFADAEVYEMIDAQTARRGHARDERQPRGSQIGDVRVRVLKAGQQPAAFQI